MTMKRILTFMRDESGVAAAEMALITPLLVVMMFGPLELGNYFWNEHKIEKGMRDAVRFAARQSFSQYSCAAIVDHPTDVTKTAALTATQIKNLARTGQLSGGTPKVGGWTDANITITVNCDATTTGGIYTGKTGGAPRVQLSTSVTYPALFNQLGFNANSITMNYSTQAAVQGI